MTDATGKLARFCLRLSELSFEVVPQADVKHQAADAIFCLPTTGIYEHLLEDNVPVLREPKRNQ